MKTSSAKAKGRKLQQWFPYSIECKNQEAVNVWKAYAQAEENCKGYEPLVVIKRNRSKPLVLVDAEHFVSLFKEDKENFRFAPWIQELLDEKK